MEIIGDFLRETTQRLGDKKALLYGPGEKTEVWSYSRLWDESSKVARWLQDQGIEKGDRIIIWAPNSPSWVAVFFGALRVGAVLVPLDMRSSDDFVSRIAEQSEPKLAIVARSYNGELTRPARCVTMEDLPTLTAGAGEPTPVQVEPNDIAEIIYTSGTTGNPKGVILTHRNIMFDVEASDKYVPNTKDFRTVSILPLSHVFEQVVGLLLSMKRDASIYYLASLQPSTIFGALAEHGATTLLLVPQALQLFMSTIEREVAKQGKEKWFHRMMGMAEHMPMGARRMMFRQLHQRLGGMLEFLVSGGAPISPDLVRKWEMLGIPIIQGYGATEAAAVISASTIETRNPTTVGKPIEGEEVRIAADGEVLLKGPNITPGYWRNPTATAEAFEDGWYKTGDLGYFDDKGLLYLHGRKKDMIALPSGQKVYPQDVEEALKSLSGVVDVAVVGLPTEDGHGQQVHAVLILDGTAAPPETLVKQANAKLAPHQYIKGYTLWPEKELPKTHTFKVKKQEVLQAVIAMRQGQSQEQPVPAAPTAV
jgi:long-chain acyl-CoA synthetase